MKRKKKPKALTIRLFDEEVRELVGQYPDMEQMYNEKNGMLKINKGRFSNYLFDYEIVSGSTYVTDQAQQQGNLLSVLELFIKNPQLIQYLQQSEQKQVKLGEIITRIMANSGIQDWDKIVIDLNKGQNPERVMEQNNAIMAQAIQEMGVPPEMVNQIPAEPQNAAGY